MDTKLVCQTLPQNSADNKRKQRKKKEKKRRNGKKREERKEEKKKRKKRRKKERKERKERERNFTVNASEDLPMVLSKDPFFLTIWYGTAATTPKTAPVWTHLKAIWRFNSKNALEYSRSDTTSWACSGTST